MALATPHHCFDVGPIIDNCPLKIESLARWGQKLLVGTSEGLLLVTAATEEGGGSAPRSRPPKYTIQDTKRSFSKNHKPIVQLDVLGVEGQPQMLVSLSDTITLHAIPRFELVSSLPKTKGCNLYCVSGARASTSSPVYLCAAVKRKVLIYTWTGPGQTLMEIKELTMPDVVRSAVFCAGSVCLGMKRDYCMVNIVTGQVNELFPVSSQHKEGNPVAIALPTREVLLAQDKVGIFIDSESKQPSRKYALTWQDPPLAVALSYPYVLAASARGIDIRCISKTTRDKCSQRERELCGVHSLVTQADAAGYGGSVFVASAAQGGKSQVHMFQPVPLMDQVDELVGMEEFTGALALCEEVASFPPESMPCAADRLSDKVKSIQKQFGLKLFDQMDFEQAIDKFEAADLRPQEVVAMFPELVNNAAETPKRVSDERYGAITAVSTYLESSRERLESFAEDDGMQESGMIAVNTALLKCYVLTKNSRKLSEHVQLPAPLCPCDVLDCAEFLLHHDKHDDAVSLYQSHGRHRDALQLLKDIGENDDVGGDGMRSTVEYLQRLGAKDEELVCEFSVWILKKDQRAGLSIFTGIDSRIAQDAAGEDTGIAPTRVREHLRQHSPRCVRGYLEHVVSRGNTSEELHNELITLYLQQLNDLEATMGDQPTPEYQDTRTKLFGVLRDSKYYNAAMLLENSSFNVQNMPEERALLLSRVGEHVQALHIFVHRMGEERKAEDYCASVYHSGDENCDDVYLALLKVYLVPQDPYRPRIEAAMRVLASHNDKMDTSKVLDMLPPETTVSDLRQFLVASIRSVNSKKRNGQVRFASIRVVSLAVH
jgi:hypothetical protein